MKSPSSKGMLKRGNRPSVSTRLKSWIPSSHSAIICTILSIRTLSLLPEIGGVDQLPRRPLTATAALGRLRFGPVSKDTVGRKALVNGHLAVYFGHVAQRDR